MLDTAREELYCSEELCLTHLGRSYTAQTIVELCLTQLGRSYMIKRVMLETAREELYCSKSDA